MGERAADSSRWCWLIVDGQNGVEIEAMVATATSSRTYPAEHARVIAQSMLCCCRGCRWAITSVGGWDCGGESWCGGAMLEQP